MASSSLTGFSSNNPTRYLGPNVSLTTIVTRNREPTGADVKQPNTGKYYPFGTLWLVGENPTTGTYGDFWYLSNIQASVAYWVQINDSFTLTLTGNTGGALSPTSDNFNIIGGVVTAGTIPVQVNGSVSTLTVNVQKAQAIASTNATNVGLAAFNSSDFSVDSNGFVSSISDTLTGDSGGAISPDGSGNINIKSDSNFTALGGTGIILGSSNQLTLDLTKALASPQPIGTVVPNSGRFTGVGFGVTPPSSGIELANATGIKYDTPSGGASITVTSNTQLVFEEGTYVPTIVGGTIPGVTTYTGRSGSYIRIGNWVWIQYYIGISGATGTGNANFSVPFACENTLKIPQSLGSKQYLSTGVLNLVQSIIQPNSNIANLREEGSTTVYQMENDAIFYNAGLFYKIA